MVSEVAVGVKRITLRRSYKCFFYCFLYQSFSSNNNKVKTNFGRGKLSSKHLKRLKGLYHEMNIHLVTLSPYTNDDGMSRTPAVPGPYKHRLISNKTIGWSHTSSPSDWFTFVWSSLSLQMFNTPNSNSCI
jgi:hypothetical protein